ncbi:MAG: hypothetical protein Q4C50_06045 [Eubacteriales bacterium]|nr:hypothetical protein [Eubacteriales bacterium]
MGQVKEMKAMEQKKERKPAGRILVIGAGREGKGYLGNVFSEGGWEVAFLDRDAAVIKALKKGSYEVMEYRAEDTRKRIVEGYTAFLADKAYGCRPAALEADVIALCLYPADIPEAIEYLLPLLKERAAHLTEKKLTIFPCTNESGQVPLIDRKLRESFEPWEITWYESHVALRDAVVRRPVGAVSSSSLQLEAGVVCPMLVGEPIYADFSGVPWMQTTPEDIDLLKELKVHTINCAHAATAYAGYLKGYQTIDEAAADPQIRSIRDGVLEEAVPVLAKVYGVPLDSLWELAVFPESKEPFSDPIVRVAYDPLRKLARHDRLTANACLCLEHGVDPVNLIQSIANGLAYDASGDEKAQIMQHWIAQLGIGKAAAKVTGLSEDHPVVRRAAAAYHKICTGQ